MEKGSPAPGKKRILEVSDNLGEINAAICKDRGFEVIQVRNGDEALRVYRRTGPFALVLTDLIYYDPTVLLPWRPPPIPGPPLKVKTGIQLTVAIRKLVPDQKVVIHTSTITQEHVPEAFSDVIILKKPYTREELESVLENLLGRPNK
jgi:CheY-like chemotaxis protein